MNADARFVMLAPIPAIAVVVVAFLPRTWGLENAMGLGLVVSGFALLTLARWQLGSAFSIAPKATILVTKGLYSRVRNPVYLFGFVTIVGLVLYLGQPGLLVALVPVAVLQIVRAGREARVLEERFGDVYRAYRSHTWF